MKGNCKIGYRMFCDFRQKPWGSDEEQKVFKSIISTLKKNEDYIISWSYIHNCSNGEHYRVCKITFKNKCLDDHLVKFVIHSIQKLFIWSEEEP